MFVIVSFSTIRLFNLLPLTLCSLENFSRFFCHLLIFFFKTNFFKKKFQDHDQSVKQFGARSGPTEHRPGLDPNCLQKLSAEGTRM